MGPVHQRQAEVARDPAATKRNLDNWSARSDSDFGLQANYLISDTVEVVAQSVSRYNYKGNFSREYQKHRGVHPTP